MQSRWHRFILSPFTLPHNPTREFLRVNSKPVTRRNGLAVTNARGIFSSGSMAILFFLNTGARARSDDFHRRISERGGRGREGGGEVSRSIVEQDGSWRMIRLAEKIRATRARDRYGCESNNRKGMLLFTRSSFLVVFSRRMLFFFYGHLTTIDAKNRASTCVKIRLIWIG